MKHHQHYFIHQVHRLLMIVAALTLWQGVSWGVTSFDIDGFKYHIYNGEAVIDGIPNIEIVKVPAEITYDSQKYPTRFGYEISIAQNECNNIKELYFTFTLPSRGFSYLPKECVIHVPDSLYEKAKSAFYGKRITDGKRWYLNSYDYYTIEQDGNTYRLFYPEDGEPYATLSDCPDGETLRVPLTVTETISSASELTYPVTGTSVNNSNIKDVYIARANVSLSAYFNSEATIHVPEAKFYEYLDAAYRIYRKNYWITDEARKARYGSYKIDNESVKSLYADFDGYTVVLVNTNNENKAYITDYPNVECVKFPSEFLFDKNTYPVKKIDIKTNSSKSSVKEIYFSNIFAALFSGDGTRQITVHVPDSLFEKALTYNSDYLYGKVTDGKRWAYLCSVHPTYHTGFHPEVYYDVTGDGKMEVFGKYNPSGSFAYSNATIFVTTLDGSVLRKEELYGSGTRSEPFYGMQMGLYDKEGLPLPASSENSSNNNNYSLVSLNIC